MSRRALVVCGDPGVPLDGPSGAGSHLRGIVRALSDTGWQVHVAVARRTDARGRFDPIRGVPVLEVHPGDWRGWGRLRELGEWWDGRHLAARCLDELAPCELVYERFSLMCDAGARIAARWRGPQHPVRHILEVNAPLSVERTQAGNLRNPPLARAAQRRVIRSAGRVIAVSSWLTEWATRLSPPQADVRYVPNGTSVRPAPHRPRAPGLTLGFIGHPRPWHGAERLPDLLDALPQAELRVLGHGPATWRPHPRLHRAPPLPPNQLGGWLAGLDVALAPYRQDAPGWLCPLKILDYRAAGVPIVAANIGDNAALIGDGGEVLSTDDPITWAAAVRRQSARRCDPWVRSWEHVLREALAEPGTPWAAG